MLDFLCQNKLYCVYVCVYGIYSEFDRIIWFHIILAYKNNTFLLPFPQYPGNICRSPIAEAVFRKMATDNGAGDKVSHCMRCYFYWMMYTLVFSPGLLKLTTNPMYFSELWIQCTVHHLLDESNWLVLKFVNIKCYYRYVTKRHLHSCAKALHKYFEILLALHLIYPLVESISIMIMLRLLLWRFDISKVAQETNVKS